MCTWTGFGRPAACIHEELRGRGPPRKTCYISVEFCAAKGSTLNLKPYAIWGHLTEETPASCGDLHMARNGTRTAAPDRTRTARDGVGAWETATCRSQGSARATPVRTRQRVSVSGAAVDGRSDETPRHRPLLTSCACYRAAGRAGPPAPASRLRLVRARACSCVLVPVRACVCACACARLQGQGHECACRSESIGAAIEAGYGRAGCPCARRPRLVTLCACARACLCEFEEASGGNMRGA